MPKKKDEKPAKKPEKPADRLTTDEAITKLFPKPLLDLVKDRLDQGKK